jgi:peptidoglycan-associated lipoprotein
MKRILTLALLLAIGFGAAQAQPLRRAAYDVLLQSAAEQYENKDYYGALQKYEEAYDEKRDRSLLPIIAELHYKIRDYRGAERTYRNILRRDDENEFVDLRYEYGRMLKMNEKYPEAVIEFEEFLKHTANDSLRTLAQNEIAGAEMAMNTPPPTKKVNMENAGRDVNSRFSEYSPVFSRDATTMYFSSFDTDDVIVVTEDSNDHFARIVMAKKDDRGWEDPEELDTKINRPGVHNVNVSIAPDGNRMFFTQATLEGNVMSAGKIYYSVGGDGAWKAAQEVQGINSDDYINKQPAVGELFGREVLFFASDMPGGYGGFDLYYATIESEGSYSDPVNLGPTINTPGDEETPFYFDGTLYFASTGHPGFGGFDIFYTLWDGSNWSDVTNMGNAYNTSVDDYSFALDNEGYNGLLTSNREGGRSTVSRTCCDDIYTFTVPKLAVDLVVGMFTEDRKPLVGGTVQLAVMTPGGDANSQTSDRGNRFGFELGIDMPYRIIATHPDYYPDTIDFNTNGVKESKTFEERFYLKAKPLPPPEPEFDTIVTEQPIVLENILYDFDDDRIRDEAESDLQVVYELMTEYPDMVIELSSHTDNRGNDRYNEDLSQRRAESARRWLVRKGIDRDRIVAKGYGENQPQTVSAKQAAQHEFLNEGDVMTPEFIANLSGEEQQEIAHEINRRTEFKILEGPTSIVIKRTRLRKKDANDRNSLIEMPKDTMKISEMSTLYGREDLSGVPIMHFEERSIDFGMVKKGEKREHTFEFVNRGDVPLVIEFIDACTCTTVDWSEEPVEPGERGAINVTFDSAEKDEAETIGITIFLENTVPVSGDSIIEMLEYKFDIQK